MTRARCLMVRQHYQARKNHQIKLLKIVKNLFAALRTTTSMLVSFLRALMVLISGLSIRFVELNF